MDSGVDNRPKFDLFTMLNAQEETRLTPTPDRPFFDVNWHLATWDRTKRCYANTNDKKELMYP